MNCYGVLKKATNRFFLNGILFEALMSDFEKWQSQENLFTVLSFLAVIVAMLQIGASILLSDFKIWCENITL